MTIRPYRIGAALALLSALAGTAQAQTHRMHLGPRLSYQFDAEEVGLGAQFSVPIASQLEFYPSFDIFFTSPNSLWSFNADLKWRVAPTSVSWLYLGTGLNLMGGGGGDGFAAGLFYGLLTGADPQEADNLGWAHGALITTFPGDTTMATVEQVRAFARGGSARIQR